MSILKKELYAACVDYVQQRIEAAKQAIDDAQAASEEETKSSAGDKYETGREMMQQITDRNMKLLNDANKLKIALGQININGKHDSAEPGSVVKTDNGNFFIAISAGVIKTAETSFFAISPASPIGLKLKGLKKGNKFSLNEKTYLIEEVI